MSFIRRLVSAACATSALFAGLTLPQAALAADTQVHLPFTSYTSMLVDEAHDHIYFTSGTSTLTITDLTGANPVTRSGLGGAVGLALSPDGSTVYVAARAANEIAAIDTTTLAVTTPFTGVSCPRYLAFAGGKLYFSYGCTAGQGNIGSVDFSGASPSVATALISDYWYGPPALAAGSPDSGVLAAADADTEPDKIVTYDVSSGAPTKLAQNRTDVCENFQAMAVTSTGALMALACGSPYHVTMFNTADLSTVDTYGDSSPYPAGVAISATDGAIAAGFSQHNPNVAVYGVGTPVTPINQYDVQAGGSGFLVADGMRFGSSGDLYIVVPTSVYNNDFDLVVQHDPTLPVTDVSISAAGSVSLGQSVSVSGDVSSATSLANPIALDVTRHDATGTHTRPSATTDSNGHFSFEDTPSVAGSATYTVTYAGDSSHGGGSASTTVNVARLATTVSLTSDRSRYGYGATARVTAHVGPTDDGRTVSIYATPSGQQRRLVKTGLVNANRDLTASVTVTRTTTFTAVFGGDRSYAPATAARSVAVHARLSETLVGGHRSSGGYRIYHTGDMPTIRATLRPSQLGVCVYGRAQVYYNRHWHTIATRCLPTSTQGTVVGFLYGTQLINRPYRIRVEWRGNATALAQTGRWLKFKFRT